MAVYTCKMCGGKLKTEEGTSICTCEYCGTRQTLPLINDEQAANMINRAHHFRQLGEYDKAADAYTKLIATEGGAGSEGRPGADPDLFWSLVLCRYGIEYVNDPVTHTWIATCHRMQYKSILDDADYLQAVKTADAMRRMYYEQEAQYIATIQKGILEISEREEPFDVFLCYKETDADGKRTKDSVLAQEMYYQLMKDGFKVFFARITLEGKLGTEYEPYIFAALHSARTMVVIGTDPAYFSAPWVKNEWARYLSIMQEEGFRTLIVAYKDMNPYDIPDALSMYPAQDMSELGFLQELTRGIRKLAHKEEEIQNRSRARETVVITANSNVDPLLRRIGMFMEDGDFTSAMEYCEKALDIYPECAQAYLYLSLAKRGCKTVEQALTVGTAQSLLEDHDFQKVLRFGDETFTKNFKDMVRESEYVAAVARYDAFLEEELRNGRLPADRVRDLIGRFSNMNGYKDSAMYIELLERKFTTNYMAEVADQLRQAKTLAELSAVADLIRGMKDQRDTAEFQRTFDYPDDATLYEKAVGLMIPGLHVSEYIQAARMFAYLTDYQDAPTKMKECCQKVLYQEGCAASLGNSASDLANAMRIFNSLGEYADAPEKAQIAKDKWQKQLYSVADNTLLCGKTPEDIERALNIFRSLGSYSDSEERALEAEKKLKKMVGKINEESVDSKGGGFMMKKWL